MTTAHPLPSHSLSAELDEDRMEMATSPYHQPDDQDIDFELDDQREHSIEDNSMIDDNTENMEANMHHDDIMFDEDDNELLDFDQDLPMDPDDVSVTNEPQIDQDDTTDNITFDEPVVDAEYDEVATSIDLGIDTENKHAEFNQGDVQEEAANIENNDSNDTLTDPVPQNVTGDRDISNTSTNEQESSAEDLTKPETTAVVDFATAATPEQTNKDQVEQTQHSNQVRDEKTPPELAESRKESVRVQQTIENLAAGLNGSHEAQEDGTQELRDGDSQHTPSRETSPENLHPVTVRFNGEDCWLFPPLETTEVRHVFLQDIALASRPFDQMLAAIRPGLIENQDMADHDEIVFDIPALGLHICEDSKHAPTITLSRVIDMYMMLSQNEGLTSFEPLYCELSTRVCLADQFAYLDDAAFSRRMTYTDFVAEQLGSPDGPNEIDETIAQQVDALEETLHGDLAAVEEEETHASITAYYDASDDGGDEEEEQQAEDPETETPDVTDGVESAPIEQLEVEVVASNESDIKDLKPASDANDNHTEFLPTSDDDKTTVLDQDHSPRKGEPEQSTGEGQVADQNGHAAKKSSDGSAKSDEVEDKDGNRVNPDEEDLFADENISSEVPNHKIDESNQLQQLDPTEAPEDPVAENDDFDFDNWSDDEEVKTEVGTLTKPSATPSKSINGKRKLVEDDDDFLEIDVSTPEPKRSRPS